MSELTNQQTEEEALDPEELIQVVDCKPLHCSIFISIFIVVYIMFVYCIVLRPYLMNH